MTSLKNAIDGHRVAQAFHAITQGVYDHDDPDRIYELIHRALSEVVLADNFFVAWFDAQADAITFPYFVDEKDKKFTIISASDSGSLTAEVLRTGKSLMLDRAGLEARYSSPDKRLWGTLPQSWLGVPLVVHGRMVGAIGVQSYDRDKAYDEVDRRIMEIAALHAAIVLDRKQTETALADSERQYRQLFDCMLSGFALHRMITDDDGRPIDYEFVQANPAFETITGLKIEETIGRLGTELFPKIKDDPNFDWIGTYGRVALNREQARFEMQSPTSGRLLSVSAYCPKPGYFACVFDDVTEQWKARQERNQALLSLERILDNIDAHVFVADFGTKELLFVNRSLVNHQRRELTGQPCYRIFRRLESACPDCVQNHLLDGQGRAKPTYVQERQSPLTGRWVRSHNQAIRWVDGRQVHLGVWNDIHQEKMAEQKALESARLRGALDTAGAACHEINQPLQAIMGQLELLSRRLGHDEAAKDKIEQALTEVDRLAEIISRLNRITVHKTKEYLSGQEILDLDKSTA